MSSELTTFAYRHGFLAHPTDRQIHLESIPSHWSRFPLANYTICTHPELSFRKLTGHAGRQLLVLGDVFVAHGECTLDEELFRILDGSYDSLDRLSGSFVFIVAIGEELTVFTDPIGSKPVFYEATTPACFASHAALLGEATDRELSQTTKKFLSTPEFQKRTTTYLPGDLSPYDGIYQLIPNNQLQVNDGTTRRYWPREYLASTTFDDLERLWDEYFRNFSQFLGQRFESVFVGLTPGVDSRSTNATLAHFGNNLRYVTWEPIVPAEKARIPAFVEHVGENKHQWLPHIDNDVRSEHHHFLDAASRATGFLKKHTTLSLRLHQVATGHDVFVKGLGGEILRGADSRKARPFLPEDPEKLLVRTYGGPSRALGDAPEYLPYIKRAAAGYVKRANFGGDMHGMDLGDLLYWEGRMGTYGATGQLEIGAGIPTYTAINSRLVYLAAWGLPDDERLTSELLLRLGARYDRALMSL